MQSVTGALPLQCSQHRAGCQLSDSRLTQHHYLLCAWRSPACLLAAYYTQTVSKYWMLSR